MTSKLQTGSSHVPVRVEELADQYAINVRHADDWREPQLNDAKRALVLRPGCGTQSVS